MLGDVGEPQHVGTIDDEVALDQVFFGGLMHQVLLVLLRPWQALDTQLSHDRQDQLLVDHHVLLSHQCGTDTQHPKGAPGALVDVGDEAAEEEPRI